jgi:methylglyoxal synthase
MNIALIAHDAKKELLVQFCLAYSVILEKHTLCATAGTGNLIVQKTGLTVQPFLPGASGGAQQIGAMISCGEIDLLLFFRNPISRQENDPDESDILRLCDSHNIPVATNIATAEALILALQRGDLDWRQGTNGAPADIAELLSDNLF